MMGFLSHTAKSNPNRYTLTPKSDNTTLLSSLTNSLRYFFLVTQQTFSVLGSVLGVKSLEMNET